ncbi:type I polyketide synthase [Shewanella surugensis]|uniref:Acyltransferase domain-containing protein n=1 Tax=Shewanella surugensis TaxID=212020 RepID=A0ABT0L6D2_9GAMM|nr:type I polyketide synthase [Shewanella surugensis]MCL1123236.1 acyltransferase domain-containing protein [Shewanella surugensis]
MKSTTDKQHQDIAIIGMSARLPGASNVNEFWANLIDGVESISTFSKEELRESGIDEALIASPSYVPRRGIIGDAKHFDAQFFDFTPRDAETLDPQHRVFLECCWHAFEDAGYVPEQYPGKVGVFGGTGTAWHLNEVNSHPDVHQYASGTSIVTNNDKDYVTTRVSYKLNLKGPSVNVQTACSTAMVATVLGMRSLQCGDSDLIVAGAVSIDTPERRGYEYMQGGMESAQGRCYAFDSRADGTIFSRGAGVLILKRLDDALRDGDHIYSVIKGGAINNDGNLKAGFTAPSIDGQIAVAKSAIDESGIDPSQINFVEAHGTATALGDPIEFSSLSQTFQSYTDDKQFCWLGSVKSNIGHTDVASGAASLIKASLSLKHHKLPASLHYQSPNPNIDFEQSPFKMNTQLSEFKDSEQPLRALVNSFGVGGTNACLIIEEAPEQRKSDSPTSNLVFPLSAKNRDALEAMRGNLKHYLEAHPEADLADVAYTLQVGRERFRYNSFIVANERDELLQKMAKSQVIKSTFRDDPQLVFMFPGQGNQYINMAKPIYESHTAFKQAFDTCCEMLIPILGRNIKDIIFQASDSTELDRLNETQFTQPALFIVEYAMAKLLQSWGIESTVMIGHSVGEYVVACLSGVFSLDDALKAVALRGQLVQALPAGSMLAVLLNEEDVAQHIDGTKIEIAAMNYPGLCVLAGGLDEIAHLQDKLEDEGIFCKHLDTSHAFHSYMMEPVLTEFRHVIQSLTLNAPYTPFVSTVTGEWITDELATDPEYWVQHVRQPVKFSQALMTLMSPETKLAFLEVGPGRSLDSAVKQHIPAGESFVIQSSLPIAKEQATSLEHLSTSLASLWANGVTIPWARLHEGEVRNRLSLPGYPFQRKEFNLPKAKTTGTGAELGTLKALKQKKADIGDWFYIPSWKRVGQSYLNKHVSTEASCWLIFTEEHALCESIKAELLKREEPVIWVSKGERFTQVVDKNTFTVCPSESDDYRALLKAVKEKGLSPNRVLHLWNVSDIDQAEISTKSIKQQQVDAFYSPLYLQQMLIEANLVDKLQLVLVSNNTFSIAGERVYSPENALLMGPARVFYHEYSEAQCHQVDIDLSGDVSPIKLAKQLIFEALVPTDGNLIGYRGKLRWEEEYQAVYLDQQSEGVPTSVRENGVYLITGGLGGLGLLMADYLSVMSNGTLLLTYRSDLPEKNQWQSWLQTHAIDDPVSVKLASILRLEQRGNTVHLIQADSCDFEAMQTALAPFKQIHGVFHTAGIAGGGIIPLKQDKDCAQVLDPKVTGTLILDELLAEHSLDFFMLFSSISAILGDEARIDYCSGNAFMDAYAAYRNQRKAGHTTSINWGQWGDVGMAVNWNKQTQDITKGLMPNFVEKEGQLLTQINKQRSEEEYRVNLAVNQDWVIDDHKLKGQPTLVGTTILAMLHELVSHFKKEEVLQVSSLMLTQPVVYQSAWPKSMSLFVSQNETGYKYSLRSRGILDLEWQEHAFGIINSVSEALTISKDPLVDIQQRCEKKVENVALDSSLSIDDGKSFLFLSRRWDNHLAINEGRDEWLIHKSLAEVFREDLQRYPYHPALIDSTAIACINRISQDNFLPISYGKISYFAPLEADCWAHVQLKRPFSSQDPSIMMNIVFYSLTGEVLLILENYTLIKVDMDNPVATVSEAMIQLKVPEVELADKDILYHEGVSAVQRLMENMDFEQIVVATSDFAQLIRETIPERTTTEIETAEKAGSDGHSRPELSVDYLEPSSDIEREIVKVWQSILGISGVGVNDNFTELGGNSLLAVQVISAVSELFEIDVRVDLFYQDQTVLGLANLVVSELEVLLELD